MVSQSRGNGSPRRVSSTDVARAAGVSQTTVSFVLNGRTDVSIPQATRERVQLAAKQLGYRQNRHARGLVQGKSQTIGILVPRLDVSFWGLVTQGVQQECAAHDYGCLISNTMHSYETETAQVELLLEHIVDGLVYITSEKTIDRGREWLTKVVKEGTPCVVVDDRSMSDLADSVVTDDVPGAQAVVNHLIQLGHRRIGHLSGGTRLSTACDRAAGYHQALTQAGIRPDPRWVVGNSYEIGDVDAAISSLLELSRPVTAIFAANDRLAAQAMTVLEKRGLRVPEDVAVVGYSDLDLCGYMHLTTVHQDAVALGRTAARRLIQRMRQPTLPTEVLHQPTHLVIRQSCGAELSQVLEHCGAS